MSETTDLIRTLRERLDADEASRKELLAELRRRRAADDDQVTAQGASARMRGAYDETERRVAAAQPASRREEREVRNAHPGDDGDE